jgi:hypothetical protein
VAGRATEYCAVHWHNHRASHDYASGITVNIFYHTVFPLEKFFKWVSAEREKFCEGRDNFSEWRDKFSEDRDEFRWGH